MSTSLIKYGLDQYRKSLNLSDFTTGSIPVVPTLRVFPSNHEEELNLDPSFDNLEELYRHADQSQVGTTEETTFRLDARKSKEYSRLQVLNQEEWDNELKQVCEQIQLKLAPGATAVVPELYKILLYQEGDFFKIHQDAQQSDRMFASLLFFLPSPYEGGSFELYSSEPYSPGKGWQTINDDKKPERCVWVAFYTDVRHSVETVKSGYRVVLNYKLEFEGSMSPSPNLQGFNLGLEKSFIEIQKRMQASSSYCGLALPLAYKYTEATMSPQYLKGSDAFLYNALSKVGKPALRHALRVDETEVYRSSDFDGEADWESHFKGLYLMDEASTKAFRKVHEEYREDYRGSKKACTLLLTNLDGSYLDHELEWLERRTPGFGRSSPYSVHFDSKERYGWLGNMTPAAKYFYFDVVLVLLKE